MATVKISQLTAAAAATGTQELEVNESGTSKKITGAQLATYIEGEVSSSPVLTGQVSLDDGTATAPSLTNTGDTNTGIYFPNADEVGIATGGTLRVSVNSGGSLVTTGNIELGHATDTTISRSAAGVIAVEGIDVLLAGKTDTISVGYTVTPYNNGTKSSGTFTPDPANGNYQYYTNGGAHTLAAPASDCAIDILVINGSSGAGAITMSGFKTAGAGVSGSTYATTANTWWVISIRRINGVSTFVWNGSWT